MAEPALYLFDGHNLLHAGAFAGVDELCDALASFVALRGARGVVVFDGTGQARRLGPLEVRWAPHADSVIERLAAERRGRERVLVVSSDRTIHGTAGQEAGSLGSAAFLEELRGGGHSEERPARVGDRLDPETRARLERLRRGGDANTRS